jgi:uncharacterized membrane protein
MNSHSIIGWGVTGFELVGVAALIIGALIALGRFAVALLRRQTVSTAFQSLREGLARAILLGLELLVAADIINSVALEPSFTSIGVLALLVLVRTFLSWSLEVEITGAWPWQRPRRGAESAPERTSEP